MRLGGYGAASAPVDLRYTWRVPTYTEDGLAASVYARNTAQAGASLRLDGYPR
jgi:hypothetical protein